MSVDSTALERSALERKDRDELLTIAKALGGKPAARAKKADIVDLVLQLTGVEGGLAPADADGPAPEVKARPARGRKAPAAAPSDASTAPDEGASKPGRPRIERKRPPTSDMHRDWRRLRG